MTINMERKTIEMTAEEFKQAMTYGTDKYKALREIRHDYPGFTPVKIKTKKSKNDFSDLKMKDIKAYVEKHGSPEQKTHFNFITKKTVDKDGEYVEAQPFFKIKEWFLVEFPEIKKARKEYREKVEEIYAAAKAKSVA